MKKLAFLMAVMMMFTLLLAGCNNTTTSSAPESKPDESSSAEGGEPSNSGDPYANIDLSKEETVVMYVSASEPNAIKEVMEAANEKIKAAINTTIDLYFIPSSERSTKYPLVMAGGDTVDLIYTANWCYYKEQVEKAGFLELTEDFLNTYMPQTMATLPESAWKETYINGKIYMVPRSTAAIFPDRGMVVNMEIAEKYGYTADKIKTYDDLKGLLLAIGDKEASNGMYAYYASQSYTLSGQFLQYANNLINNQASDYVYYSQLSDPKFENPFFLYTSDYFKDYALLMADFAKAGVWPSDAISNTNSISTLFSNKQSATCHQNYYNGITNIESWREKGIDCELFDTYPEGYRALRDSFVGDGMAIPSFSKIPERAAVTLDFIKNDLETYMLLAGGFEGRHYIYDEATNTISNGPEAADYVFDGWAWGIRHKDFPWPKTDDERINAANKHLNETQVKDEEWPYWGFTFDYAPVSAEWAVISALVTENSATFNLGGYGDKTAAEYETFVQKLKDGGLDKYMEEWNKQRTEFLANNK